MGPFVLLRFEAPHVYEGAGSNAILASEIAQTAKRHISSYINEAAPPMFLPKKNRTCKLQ